jgi:fatty acid desaturase
MVRGYHYEGDLPRSERERYFMSMVATLLWLMLLVLCWPLALAALVLWPLIWLLTLPFRMLGIAVEGVFALLRAILFLPARVLGGRP